MVLDILPDRVGIVLFGRSEKIRAGDEVPGAGAFWTCLWEMI